MAAPSKRPTPRRNRQRDLPAGVLARAGKTPEEPALFYPDGLDVRWRSWGVLADQMAGGAAALAALGLPAGERVAFRWRGGPDGVAADLAIQAAGLVAVPVVEPAEAAVAPPERDWAAWLLGPGDAGPEGDLPAARLPEAPRPGGRPARVPGPPVSEPARGGAWVVEPGASGPTLNSSSGTILRQADLLTRAHDLDERLERAASGAAAVVPGAGRSSGPGARAIALASLDLRSADGRTVLAWALVTGAALILEPDPRVLAGSAEWARPTLVAGEARALSELGRRVRGREAGRRRLLRRRSRRALPFGRLRLLLVLGTGRLAVDDVAFWAGRGVAVVRIRN